MKKSLIAAILSVAPAFASAYTWTDVYDAGPSGLLFPKYISSGSTTPWTHDITDSSSGSFNPGSDVVTSFSITLLLSDDLDLDGVEQAQLNIDGSTAGAAQNVPWAGTLNYNGLADISWLASINQDGILNLSLTSTLGDFYFYGSKLEAYGTKAATSVPEPSSVALLAAGLLGIAAMRRNSKAS